MNPKVTVYIAACNYGRYLRQAIESVLAQTYSDFELLIFDDGSTDETPAIIKDYEDRSRIQVFAQECAGLAKTANRALSLARGQYFVRLDADDYLDENFLSVLVNALEARPNAGLVYPDHYEVDEDGAFIALHRRGELAAEARLLDAPSHGACTVYRTSILRALGGYWEDMSRQDGLAVWIRFVQKHQPHNVNLPLFCYRRHGHGLTSDRHSVQEVRANIFEKFAQSSQTRPSAGLILPVRTVSPLGDDLALRSIAGKPLLGYALDAAREAELGPIAVVTESDTVAEFCAALDNIEIVLRPASLARYQAPLSASLDLVNQAWLKRNITPAVFGIVYYTSPLTSARHLRQAVNTFAAYNCDLVVSVRENERLHYTRGASGLSPLFKRRGLKHEREALFEESGAFVFGKRDLLLEGKEAETVGHVVLSDAEAVDIEDGFTCWLAARVLENRAEVQSLGAAKPHRGY